MMRFRRAAANKEEMVEAIRAENDDDEQSFVPSRTTR